MLHVGYQNAYFLGAPPFLQAIGQSLSPLFFSHCLIFTVLSLEQKCSRDCLSKEQNRQFKKCCSLKQSKDHGHRLTNADHLTVIEGYHWFLGEWLYQIKGFNEIKKSRFSFCDMRKQAVREPKGSGWSSSSVPFLTHITNPFLCTFPCLISGRWVFPILLITHIRVSTGAAQWICITLEIYQNQSCLSSFML